MKTKFLLLIAIILSFSFVINAQNIAENAIAIDNFEDVVTTIKWAKTVHDFGKIKYKVPVSYEFEYTNNGDKPLIVTKVKASCGCTATNFSKEPLLPGENSKIKATYNAHNQGAFQKTVTAFSNDKEGEKRLKIKGTVVKK